MIMCLYVCMHVIYLMFLRCMLAMPNIPLANISSYMHYASTAHVRVNSDGIRVNFCLRFAKSNRYLRYRRQISIGKSFAF